MQQVNTKICVKCKEEKPLTVEFWHRLSKSKDGFKYSCKECRNFQGRKYLDKNRERERNRLRRFREENREKTNKESSDFRKNNKEGRRKLIRENRDFWSEEETKICTECNKSFPASLEYFSNKDWGKFGLNSLCKICAKLKRDKNKVKIYKKRKDRYENDHEYRAKRKKDASEYREKNRKSLCQKQQKYRRENKDLISKRLKDDKKESPKRYSNYSKKAYEKAKRCIFKRIKKVVSGAVYGALKKSGSSKNSPTWKKLPYTPQQLKEHIESLFEPWMAWECYGKSKNGERTFVIDHIIPQAALPYDSMDHPNFLKCWSLSNLRPLCSRENASKGSLHEGVRHKYNSPSK
jgi:hypothetical protein